MRYQSVKKKLGVSLLPKNGCLTSSYVVLAILRPGQPARTAFVMLASRDGEQAGRRSVAATSWSAKANHRLSRFHMNEYGFVRITCVRPGPPWPTPRKRRRDLAAFWTRRPAATSCSIPELCVTGYTCADLFGQSTLFDAGIRCDATDRPGDGGPGATRGRRDADSRRQ